MKIPTIPDPISPEWRAALEDFAAWQSIAKKADSTIALYRYRLLLIAMRFPDPVTVTNDDLNDIHIANPQWGPDATKSISCQWRVFFRWMRRTRRRSDEPTEELPEVRIRRRAARPCPDVVIEQAIADARAVGDERLVLMIMLAAYAGLRTCEIAVLHGSDLVGDMLHIRGKGSNERFAPLSGEMLEIFEGITGYAFLNVQRGGHITPGHVSVLLSAGLPGKWTAHTLRHRYATIAYEQTGDIVAVSQLMGHANTKITEQYIGLSTNRLRAAAFSAQRTFEPLAIAPTRRMMPGDLPDAA